MDSACSARRTPCSRPATEDSSRRDSAGSSSALPSRSTRLPTMPDTNSTRLLGALAAAGLPAFAAKDAPPPALALELAGCQPASVEEAPPTPEPAALEDPTQ